MYSLHCRVCDKPLTAVDQMDGKCQGTSEQKAQATCGLNNHWYDYWNTVIFNELKKSINAVH